MENEKKLTRSSNRMIAGVCVMPGRKPSDGYEDRMNQRLH